MEFIVNAISILTVNITRFFTMCKLFFQSVIDFFNNCGNILSTLWFGLKTLTIGTWNLIVEIFSGSLFDYLYSGFNDLSYYVGFHCALFISSLLFVIFVRIAVGFVFKMFRLNVDYKTMQTKRK